MIRRFASLGFALLIALSSSAPAAPQESKKSSTSAASSSSKAKSAAKISPTKKSEPVEASPAETGGVPKIRAASAIVIDANSGRVLHEVNADKQRPVASTQK